MSQVPREQWGSRLGFVLAAVGSAVGLGNMWRFSYLAAENGGAAFFILYMLMTLGVGLPVMLAEFTVGRGARKSPIQRSGSKERCTCASVRPGTRKRSPSPPTILAPARNERS